MDAVRDDPQVLDLSPRTKRGRNTALVFLLTFLAYTSFHLSRKPASIVKSTLHPSAPHGYSKWNAVTHPGWAPFNRDLVPSYVAQKGYKVWDSTGVIDGHYDCTNLTSAGICNTYTRSGSKPAYLVRSDLEGSDNCWELRDAKQRVYYVQRIADAPHKTCQELPAFTTYTSSQWHQGPGITTETPQCSPSVTSGKILLGSLDTIFLSFYAIGMFFAGHIGDRVNLRYFLWIGMWGSGIFVAMLGAGYKFKTHSFLYFAGIYAIQGCFQSIGWPSVVAVMGNWVPRGTRGLPMGIWNAHTSVGNILGSLISVAGLTLGMHSEDWPAAFFLCALCIMFTGTLIILFLKPHPRDVGLAGPNDDIDHDVATHMLASPMVGNVQVIEDQDEGGIGMTDPLLTGAPRKSGGILRALAIPGVIPFALALFFAKLVAYTFIYWLPLYLTHLNYTSAEAGKLSTFFDIGGIFGGIAAGFISDKLKMPGTTAAMFLLIAIPSLYMYRHETHEIGDTKTTDNILLMLFCGAIVNAPYALITTAVSADLGSHPSLKGESTLMATVTAIIDGTGSAGAAIQGILIGWLSAKYSWNGVFVVLNICSGASALCLCYIIFREFVKKCSRPTVKATEY